MSSAQEIVEENETLETKKDLSRPFFNRPPGIVYLYFRKSNSYILCKEFEISNISSADVTTTHLNLQYCSMDFTMICNSASIC